MSDFRNDPLWKADYETALAELTAAPRLLPAPPERRLLTVLELERPQDSGDPLDATFAEVPRYRPIPMECHDVDSRRRVLGELDIESLGPVELRCEILRRTAVRKTGNPNVREVRYLGEPVGQIARSPWVFNTWLASSDRRNPCSSIADASVVVVLDALRSGGAV
jgi:hypothetical protein